MLHDYISFINESTAQEDKKWLSAIKNQNFKKIQSMIDAGYDINTKIPSTRDIGDFYDIDTALIYSSQNGDKDVVELLLKNGASADIEDSWGNLPLHLACLENPSSATPDNHKRVIEMLVPVTKDINSVNSNEQTPLSKFLQSYSLSVSSGNITMSADDFKYITSLLVSNGSEINVDQHGTFIIYEFLTTMLQSFLVNDEMYDICQYLIDLGVDVNTCNKNKVTVLSNFLSRNNSKSAKFMLENHADVTLQDVSGKNPLQYGSKIWKDKNFIEFIILKRPDVIPDFDNYYDIPASLYKKYKDVIDDARYSRDLAI